MPGRGPTLGLMEWRKTKAKGRGCDYGKGKKKGWYLFAGISRLPPGRDGRNPLREKL